MAASLQEYYDGVLHDVVLKGLIYLTKNDTVFSKRLKSTSQGVDIKGKLIKSTTMIRAEQGLGMRARGALTYPLTSKGKLLIAESDWKYGYGAIEVGGPEAMQSDKAADIEAVVSVITLKGSSLGESYATDRNRQYFGDGAGTLAKVKADQLGVTTIDVDDTRYIDDGMIIDIHEGSVIENRVVESVDDDANTIDISGVVVNVTDATVITRADSKDNEIEGLAKMISDTGTYLNISRATFAKWRSYVKDGKGEPFNLDVINEMFVKAIHRKKARPSICYTDDLTLLYLIYLLEKKGIKMDTIKIELGYEVPVYIAPEIGRVPIHVEMHCQKQTFYGIDERFISLRQIKEPWFAAGTYGHWIEDQTEDKMLAKLKWYGNIFSRDPSKHMKYHNYKSPMV